MDTAARCDVASPWGPVSILWHTGPSGPQVGRIVLPNEQASIAGWMREDACPEVAMLGHQLRRFLSGESVSFDLGLLDFSICSPFQRAVLLIESAVPRGQVTTYGRIAARLGKPTAARAVGGALARNPFPLIVPCHRAIRSDGRLGGFRGGLKMKRALLEYEGIAIDDGGRVRIESWAI